MCRTLALDRLESGGARRKSSKFRGIPQSKNFMQAPKRVSQLNLEQFGDQSLAVESLLQAQSFEMSVEITTRLNPLVH